MLMRTDPFRELDRLTQQLFGFGGLSPTGVMTGVMPIDAYRVGDEFVVHFDLPGVQPDSNEVDVQRDVLTVQAERRPLLSGDNVNVVAAERPVGRFSRQLFLSDSLDTDGIKANYDAGVLTLRIPVAEHSRPRKIAITGGQRKEING